MTIGSLRLTLVAEKKQQDCFNFSHRKRSLAKKHVLTMPILMRIHAYWYCEITIS